MAKSREKNALNRRLQNHFFRKNSKNSLQQDKDLKFSHTKKGKNSNELENFPK